MVLEYTFSVLPLKASSLSSQIVNEIGTCSAISQPRQTQMDALKCPSPENLQGCTMRRNLEAMRGLQETVVLRSSSYLNSRTFRHIIVNFKENSLQNRQILRLRNGKRLKKYVNLNFRTNIFCPLEVIYYPAKRTWQYW